MRFATFSQQIQASGAGGTLFKWLKQRQIKEYIKLLYQNGAASGALVGYYEHKGNAQAVIRLKEISDDTHRIAVTLSQTGSVPPNDVHLLLTFNREVRRYFDEAERGGGEAKLRELMGQPKRIASFDKTFQPVLGWEEYYSTW